MMYDGIIAASWCKIITESCRIEYFHWNKKSTVLDASNKIMTPCRIHGCIKNHWFDPDRRSHQIHSCNHIDSNYWHPVDGPTVAHMIATPLTIVQLKMVSKMGSITNICNAVLDYVPMVP